MSKQMMATLGFGTILALVGGVLSMYKAEKSRNELESRVDQLNLVGKSLTHARFELKAVGLGLNPVNLSIGQSEDTCKVFDYYPDKPKFTMIPFGLTRTRVIAEVDNGRIRNIRVLRIGDAL